jgi:hypothetical protein
MARPTEYCEELANEICETIATNAKGLIALCAANPHWPPCEVIYRWKRRHPEFGLKYAQAKVDQIEPLVDECIDIADDLSHDNLTRYNHEGEEYEVANNEWINRSRLRIDTRKWFASKLAPKIYGDKVEHKISASLEDVTRKVRDANKQY